MKKSKGLFLFGITILCLLFSFFIQNNLSLAQNTNIPTGQKIQAIIKEYIKQNGGSGVKVIGFGSWVSGDNYRDPLSKTLDPGTVPSDHDMRLFIKPGTSEEVAKQEWKYAREFLIDRINKEFSKDEAKVILKSINLYPPNELIGKVDDLSTAKKLFQELGKPPNLATDEVEGLWSKGGKSFRQHYETTKGRVFYQDTKTGKVFGGFADIEHLVEGYGKYTPDGMGSMGKEWIEHFYDELAKENPDPKYLKKYIERLDDSLKKGKDLVRVRHNSQYLQGLMNQLDSMKPGDPIGPELQRSINQVIKEAKVDIELLQKIPTISSAKKLEMMYALLDEENTAWNKLRKALYGLADNIPVDTILTSVFVALDGYTATDEYAKGNIDGAVRKLFEAGVSYIGFGPGLLAAMTNAIIEDAKANGYIFVAGTQNCEDLMNGFCEAIGRGQTAFNSAPEWSIEKVIEGNKPVTDKQFQTLIQNKLQLMSNKCSDRDYGTETAKSDKGVEGALYDKCLVDLTKKWNIKRFELMGQIAGLETEFNSIIKSGQMGIYYDPDPVILSESNKTVKVSAGVKDNSDFIKAADKYTEMKEILKKIAGTSYINVTRSYIWYKDGQEIKKVSSTYFGSGELFEEDKATAEFTFDKEETYDVDFKFEMKLSYVLDGDALEGNLLNDSINKLRLDQTIQKDTTIRLAAVKETPAISGDVTIDAPDEVNRNDNERFSVSAKLSDGLKDSTDLYIYWYINDKSSGPYTYGNSFIKEIPEKEEGDIKVFVEVTNECKPGSYENSMIPGSTGTLTCTQPKPKELKVFAQASKTIKIVSRTSNNEIETAFRNKDWKKLLSIYPEKKEETELRNKYILELAKEFNAENEKLLEAFLKYEEKNKTDFEAFEKASQAKARSIKVDTTDSPEYKAREKVYDCIDQTKTRYEQELSKLIPEEFSFEDGIIDIIKNLIEQYKKDLSTATTDPSNFPSSEAENFFKFNEQKHLRTTYDLSKPLPVVNYNNFCSDSNAIKELSNPKISIKTTNKYPGKGETIRLSAIVELPPYNEFKRDCPRGMGESYKWTGANFINYQEGDQSVDFSSAKLGSYPIKVTAMCNNAVMGNAEITIDVQGGIKGEITGLPQEAQYGSSYKLKALSSGSEPVTIVWNSTPNITFEPIKGSETTVTFDRMQSPAQIWAELKTTQTDELMGRTENYPVNVVAPQFEIKYTPSPDKVKLGQKVKAEIIAGTPVNSSIIDYRWVEPGDMATLSNGVIEFTPKTDKPINVHIIVRVPTYGDIITELRDTFTPGEYKIVAKMKELKGQIDINEEVPLIADIFGIDESQVDFEWSVDNSCNFIGGRIGAEVKINKNEPGTCNAKVIAYNKDKTQIGQAEVSFTIGSPEQIAEAKTKESQKSTQSDETLKRAAQLEEEGQLNAAVQELKKAAEADPTNKEIAEKLATAEKEMATVKSDIDKFYELTKEGKFEEAEKLLNNLKTNHPKDSQVKVAEDNLISMRGQRDKDVVDAVTLKSKQGNLDEAIKEANELAKQYPNNKKLLELAKKLQSDKELTLQKIEAANKLLDQKKFAEAEVLIKEAQALNFGYEPVRTAYDRLVNDRRMFSETGGRIDSELKQAKYNAEKGRLNEAITAVENVLKLDPNNKEAAGLLDKYKSDLETINQQIAKVKEDANKGDFSAAEIALAKAQTLNPEYLEVKQTASWLELEKRNRSDTIVGEIGSAYSSLGARHYEEALNKVTEIRSKYKVSGQNEIELVKIENNAKTDKTKKENALAKLKDGENDYNNYKYNQAFTKLTAAIPEYEIVQAAGENVSAHYREIVALAHQKDVKLIQLIGSAKSAISHPDPAIQAVKSALTAVEEILVLQPNNSEAPALKDALQKKLQKVTTTQLASSPTTTGQNWGKATPSNTSPTTTGQNWGKATPSNTSPTTTGQNWGKPSPTTPSSGQAYGRVEPVVAPSNNVYTQPQQPYMPPVPQKTANTDLLRQYLASKQQSSNNIVGQQSTLQHQNTQATINNKSVNTTPKSSSPQKSFQDILDEAERCMMNGNHAKAINLLNQAKSLQPRNKEIYEGLASVYIITGNNQLAIEAMKTVKMLDPSQIKDIDMVIKFITDPALKSKKDALIQQLLSKYRAESGTNVQPTQPASNSQNYSGTYVGSISGDKLTGSLTLKVSGNQAEIYTNGNMKVFSENYNYSFTVSGRGIVDPNGKVTMNTVSGQLSGLGEIINVTGSMSGKIESNQITGIWTGQGSWTESGTWYASKR